MKTNDIKQIIVTRFEKPIDEVQEALEDVYGELISKENRHNVFAKLKIVRGKISNLKALLPTIQS